MGQKHAHPCLTFYYLVASPLEGSMRAGLPALLVTRREHANGDGVGTFGGMGGFLCQTPHDETGAVMNEEGPKDDELESMAAQASKNGMNKIMKGIERSHDEATVLNKMISLFLLSDIFFGVSTTI